MKTLLTGGTGRLGKELLHLNPNWLAPSSKELNILDPHWIDCDMLVHSAAYTKVVDAENNPNELLKCLNLNFYGTLNLLNVFNVPFVFICSEYAQQPSNNYSFTKKLASSLVDLENRPTLTLYAPFWSRPFPHEMACYDVFTDGDYVDVMAKLVSETILNWDMKTKNTVYLGTGKKSILELAQRTKPDIKSCSFQDIKLKTNVTISGARRN